MFGGSLLQRAHRIAKQRDSSLIVLILQKPG